MLNRALHIEMFCDHMKKLEKANTKEIILIAINENTEEMMLGM